MDMLDIYSARTCEGNEQIWALKEEVEKLRGQLMESDRFVNCYVEMSNYLKDEDIKVPVQKSSKEDGQDEYEKDGFIVDDVEEEEEEDRDNSDEERQKKKKRKKRDSDKNYELDEDDYELLQESNISVHPPKPGFI